jgi:molybdate transport system substrate-binding protein
MKRSVAVAVAVLVVALAIAAPAFGAGQTHAAKKTKLDVFAASSLIKVFPKMATKFKADYPKYKNVQFVFNFNGTGTLVTQLELGAPCDLIAGAKAKDIDAIYPQYVNQPRNFCQNRLEVIMPKNNPGHLTSLAGLTKTGVTISIGDSSVPVGEYTQTVLTNLDALYGSSFSTGVMANVVSTETEDANIVALVELGAVDAGFVYHSDAFTLGKKVTHLVIPNAYQSSPLPTYPIAVTKTAKQASIAQAFMNFVLSKRGQKIMKAFGFLPPPKS